MLVHLTLRPPNPQDAKPAEPRTPVRRVRPFRPSADVVALRRYALQHAA